MKAIVLFSGGLDSILAAALLKSQGIDVLALCIKTPFHDCDNAAQVAAEIVEIPIIFRAFGNDYMNILVNPRWGFGKAVNPCIDCRVMMCQVAATVMEEEKADFVATGEIAGQRPNSQKMHQLELITRESGLGERLLRPLCAKVMPATLMEREGTVNREKLRSFTGRHRGNLIAMARKKFGLTHIPQPSTGCLLCEKSFAPRIKDLLRFNTSPTTWDGEILDAGRQIRIDSSTKAVVGRRALDCQLIDKLFACEDRSPCLLATPANFQGAAVLLVADYLAPDFNADNPPEAVAQAIRWATALSLHFTKPLKFENAPGGPGFSIQFSNRATTTAIGQIDETVATFKMIEEKFHDNTP